MPLPTIDLLIPETLTHGVTIDLEPAHNVQHSLMLLERTDELSGMDEWVYRTVAQMTAEEREKHRLVMIGLFYATRPEASYSSFPAFLDHLAAVPPESLRDKVLNAYIEMAAWADDEPLPEAAEVMADINSFLTFLRRGFGDDHVFPEVEQQAYTYLLDPPAMQELIVSHLRHMWHKYMAVEWERVRPMLQKAVTAFRQIDFSGQSREAIARQILDRDAEDICYIEKIEDADAVTFVPSAHVGPYVGKALANGHMWILFGARQPDGAVEDVPELGRAEILVRLSALADDTRLSILKLVAESGELRSQDIMERLDLSQSGASRHLKQLSATGILRERRCNGAKCYELNDARIDNTLQAVSGFLLDQ
ncbi:MAG: metalloregulator ArsR/SmtB family transcription factor [Chloroflexota bacterium]